MNLWEKYSSINSKVIITLCVFSLVHIVLSLVYFNPVDFWLQYQSAIQISQGKILYYNLEKVSYQGTMLQYPHYPPLYLYSLAALLFITQLLLGSMGASWQVAKMFLVVFNILDGILIYKIVKKLGHSDNAALWSMICFLGNPVTLGVVIGGFHDNFFVFFLLLTLNELIKENPGRLGIFLGLATMIKPPALICLSVFVPYYMRENKNDLMIFLVGMIILIVGISAPFLWIAPYEFLSYTLLNNLVREDPNMSVFNYWFSSLSITLVPFILQSIVFILVFLRLYRNPRSTRSVIVGLTIIFSATLSFNRIIYPHYLPWILAFLTITLIETWDQKYFITRFLFTFRTPIISTLAVVYLGAGLWSLAWFIDPTPISYGDIWIYWLGAGLYFVGMLSLLIILLRFFFSKELDGISTISNNVSLEGMTN